ncbi:golgin subfamily B member 1 isoform X1 [Takifugu rubripes]|uniref:Golgin B1 n=1 Tax=Takifugu rubripes TaxID=31033 RepID=A0A3B5K687_TAKRU|nr:golgin subfamily B member 1-like isoform X1 [Takifugu rubripes]
MFSRLATVLQELSGEEGPDGEAQGELVPQLPANEGEAPAEPDAPEEVMERLAHLEQLVVQLKELIRDKDTQLAQKDTELTNKDAQFKHEKEDFEARFTKLKLQAKAKMASLNKQITDLKGSGPTQSPDTSFSGVGSAAEEELQEFKNKLSEEEAKCRELQERLQTTEQLLQEKEAAHAEQLQKLQAVVCEKDVRFQEQVQTHEEELLRATSQSQVDVGLQQALQEAQRRCEELEEALNSRSQVVEMLQQEVSSADQQKQILTAQFRQMEQELAEALKQREEEKQEWVKESSRAEAEMAALRSSMEALERQSAEVVAQESELASLREAERVSQEALEKEKLEVARLESEVVQMRGAKLASQEASERDGAEIVRLENELASLRDAFDRACQGATEREKLEVEKLEQELASQREAAQENEEILAEVWRRLQSLAAEDVAPTDDPADLSLFLFTVQSVATQLTGLKDERSEGQRRCDELTRTVEDLQEQLDNKITEQQETAARVEELEQQIMSISEKVHLPSELDSSESKQALIMQLEQQLLEKDSELVALRDSISQAKEDPGSVAPCGDDHQMPDQGPDAGAPLHDTSHATPDLMDDTQDEETTLVAEDTTVLSLSADNGSSPELIVHQSESPEESKGTSSDEMITSSDSEVAHSSWTLLEAVNQDGGQEWPPMLQEFGQLQLQRSWEASSVEVESSTVQVESSSVAIRETVQVYVTQQNSSSSDDNISSGQAFAQALAEELQKRYSDLLVEVQRLREAAAESAEKIKMLQEDAEALTVAKEDSEIQASSLAEELKLAREQLEKLSHQNISAVKKHNVEMQLLEEQIDILNATVKAKEEKIQNMQADLEMVNQAFSEKEMHVKMLSVQLEDRELVSSVLEKRVQDMENSMLEYSQSSELKNDALSLKDSEISTLQFLLSQKEQEVTMLNESMSSKLLQAEEEKFQIDCEVSKLKEQIEDLEKVKDKKGSGEDLGAPQEEELEGLRQEKGALELQLTNMKKKLQAALVQRKELMKKVADLETEAKKREEAKLAPEDTPEDILNVEQPKGSQIQEMEAKLMELEEALRCKDEEVETLKEKISQQDQALIESLALSGKLGEEAENANRSSETTLLQSQVSSLETECESLQKKVQEVQESRKETIRKAKEKDRHHREQLKQQKEEYKELMERLEVQNDEREALRTKLRDLEEKASSKSEEVSQQEPKQMIEKVETQTVSDWVQEDWVDFAEPETDSAQPQSSDPSECPAEQSDVHATEVEESLKVLRREIEDVRLANEELEKQLQETQTSLSLKEAELMHVGKELQSLQEKENQIDSLLEEMRELREKHHQAQLYAETLKAEMDDAARAASADAEVSMANLQAEVESFKQFLESKNHEIHELSEQLHQQNSLIQSTQDAVSQKDRLILSLQEELQAEQEKTQRLEVEVPQKQEEERDSEAKIQQLQRKLQAALISRKEALKGNKTQKEQLASTEARVAELQEKLQAAEGEMEKLREEKAQLIEEVDRALLENQSLGSSCESLKLVMEGILNEKDDFKREVELAKEEAARVSGEWEDKVRGMKDEYETLLKSYENVSDEAERVRKVLEAARQERQELTAKVRTHEAGRQEAERQAEEAQKEVEVVKDKMRKFAKTKQQKILELEEENERLREMQEKPRTSREEKALKDVTEELKAELEATKAELEATKAEQEVRTAERTSLEQEIEELREKLAQAEEAKTVLGSAAVVEEVVTAQQSDSFMTRKELVESQNEEKEKAFPIEEAAEQTRAKEIYLNPSEEIKEAETAESVLVEKMRGMEAERELWQQQKAELESQLSSLEKDLQDSKEKETLSASLEKSLQETEEREKSLIEEGSRREIQFKELLQNLETEKDNLEERLMNQLAQLNGSIAGYQQEAADNREHLAQLQREVERLERERAELDAQAQCQSDRAARLEEDMRQAQRERAEAEAESGRQRELEQQLRSAQRVKEGSQSRARQLEELLREKQLEVRQLQKDSIRYQERISELGREVKAVQLGHSELHKKLEESTMETSKTAEELKRTEAELVGCRSQLAEAQRAMKEALAEKATVEEGAQQREATLKAEAEQTIDSVRFRLGAELKQMELRLEDVYSEREKEEEATQEARESARRAEARAQESQARLEESLARLAAFSRSMSSLQDDRDRVLDEARQWEARFNDALQGKEAEVREAEARAKELTEQLQKESARKEELQLWVDRLEKSERELQNFLEEERHRVAESEAALKEEKGKLKETTAELLSAQNAAHSLEKEAESLLQRIRALEEAVGRLQGEADRARAELREREAEERRLCLNVEQLETDLRSSKAFAESLQTELHEKERREVEMLGEKEQAVAEAAEEARKEAVSRAQGAEEELEQRRRELRDLEEKMRKSEEESNNRKARLDSFMKAMGSLQDDRDRVLNTYKQLEEKHLQVMVEKDSLIQEAAGENNGLKEQLRSLLIQTDDLYAEKAKLSAELHGYRDQLKQVLSMKDSQHKQQLAAQRERISSLEKERQQLERQLAVASNAREAEVGADRVERESLSRAAEVVYAPGAEVEKLREQLQAARAQVEALEETVRMERKEHESKSKELAHLQWEGGVMRTESETAQERVAELARDLLAVEQKLMEEKEAAARLRTQNESLTKAMASLQDSRDQAVDRVQELSLKVGELSKAGGHAAPSGPAGAAGEVWGLKNALQALQNDRERLLEQIQAQLSELNGQKSELARLGAGELIKVNQQLLEEKTKNGDMLAVITQLENVVETGRQEIEALRLERIDWMAQAEQLKQQTLATLSDRDQQLRTLTALLEEARSHEPKPQQEHYQREGAEEADTAPGAPQQRSQLEGHAHQAEIKALQRRLEEEMQQRSVAEEQLMATQDRLKRVSSQSQAQWRSAQEDDHSETAVFIEPSDGAVTRSRRGSPGWMRMLRVTFCSRQRTPLLLSLYLLTVHVLLLLCMGGYL